LGREDEVVDSKKVTPTGRRDADEPEGNRGEVASIAAGVHGALSRRGASGWSPVGLRGGSVRLSF